MRHALILVALSIAGCVIPVKRTDYDAVDLPWSKGTYNGSLTDCPPRGYGVGDYPTHMMVGAGHGHPGNLVGMDAWVAGDHQLRFVSWELRLKSLTDARVEVALPLSFGIDCTPRGGNLTYCPTAQDPKILFGGGVYPNGRPRTNSFQAIVNIPPEFESGFYVVLPELFDDSSRIDTKPLRFELRTRTTTTGPMGC